MNASPQARSKAALVMRQSAADYQARLTTPVRTDNGDETRYPNKIGTFTKCLPHSPLGEVDLQAYDAFSAALAAGSLEPFEAVPTATTLRLGSPLSGQAFDSFGPDAQALAVPTPCPIDSDGFAAQLLELYWMSLTRDVPFGNYAKSDVVQAAIRELSGNATYMRLACPGGSLTAHNLFCAPYSLVDEGPRVSQFLLWDFAWDGVPVQNQLLFPVPCTKSAGIEFLTEYDEWLNAQNGFPNPSAPQEAPLDTVARYIATGRDLGWAADQSGITTTYLKAGMQLLSLGKQALDAANPYRGTSIIGGMGTFDIAHLQTLLGRAASARHFNYWKWFHRRLRPEAAGGLLHNHLVGRMDSAIKPECRESEAVRRIFAENRENNRKRGGPERDGTYLLPVIFGEGCPAHPSYPQGHGTAAGIGATLLKCWFDEDYVLPNQVTVQSDASGQKLLPYVAGKDGPQLTIGGELNKLASNITWGRNMSGLHYLDDGLAANALGEQIAIQLLGEDRIGYPERFQGFTLRRFNGERITVG